MRLVEWIKGLLGPRHTVESVALELARGLEDGSITLGRPVAADGEPPVVERNPVGTPANGANRPASPAEPAASRPSPQ